MSRAAQWIDECLRLEGYERSGLNDRTFSLDKRVIQLLCERLDRLETELIDLKNEQRLWR